MDGWTRTDGRSLGETTAIAAGAGRRRSERGERAIERRRERGSGSGGAGAAAGEADVVLDRHTHSQGRKEGGRGEE